MKLIDTAGTPKDLRDKWDRYESIQYNRMEQRKKLSHEIALCSGICAAFLLFASAYTNNKETRNARLKSAAAMTLVAGGLVAVQKPLEKRTLNRMAHERKNWFGTVGPDVPER